MFSESIKISDKIISALSYLTGGLAGIVWQIYCAVTKKTMTKFLLFNIYQSVFLSLLLYFANLLFGMIYNLLVMIPFINILANSIYFALYSPVYYRWSIVGLILFGMYIYLMLFAILGRISYLPWVSNIILYQLKRF